MKLFNQDYQLFSHNSVASTNNEVCQLYQPGQMYPIVLAQEQTGGRGRQGKNWYSPVGNLYGSFVIEANFSPLQTAQLSLLTGLAIQQVLTSTFPQGLFLCKWPNDILCNNKKIAGILIEKNFRQEQSYFVIGIGLNLSKFDTSSAFPSTCLSAENLSPAADCAISHMPVFQPGVLQWWMEKIINRLSVIYDQWMKEGFGNWQQTWNSCCYGWGKNVKLPSAGCPIQGSFQGINAEGHLMIQQQKEIFLLSSGTLEYFNN